MNRLITTTTQNKESTSVTKDTDRQMVIQHIKKPEKKFIQGDEKIGGVLSWLMKCINCMITFVH